MRRWLKTQAAAEMGAANEAILPTAAEKSQIEILLPEPKLIRITTADCYYFCPPYSQTTACCKQLFFVNLKLMELNKKLFLL
jgi:hypothetical protein